MTSNNSLLAQYEQFVTSKIIKGLTPDEKLNLAILGICGEAGEIADNHKKATYHHKFIKQSDLVKEMGDLLFYLVLLADCYNTDLEEVIETNIEKLNQRYTSSFSVEESENRVE